MIWGAAAVAALWLGATALGGVTKASRPDVALTMLPKNGFAYERRAMNATMRGQATLQTIRLSQADVADALAALRREPLASTALTIVGLDRGARGDSAAATRIVTRANALDKRQLVANAWLINYHGLAGQDRRVLSLLDEALKINPPLAERYAPALAQALIKSETIPAFQRLLAQRPVWGDAFWDAVAGTPAALPNGEVLRARMLSGPESLGPVDTLLMDAFVRARRMDLALSYSKHLPVQAEDSGNLIRNSSFNELPRMAPLDWELRSDGRVGSGIDEARGSLQINAIAGSSAVAARQLIALPPGNYVMFAKLGQATLPSGSDLQVHVFCAEANPAGTARFDVRFTDDIESSFAIPGGAACRFYWVDIEFSTMDATGPALASLAELRIVRARTQPAGSAANAEPADAEPVRPAEPASRGVPKL